MVSTRMASLTPLLLAGGLASRLGDLAADLPKALLGVGGRPFIHLILEALEGMGFSRAVICTGHLGDAFIPILGEKYGGMALDYSHEKSPLGTAGALVHARPLISTSHVLAMNADSFIPFDWDQYFDWHFKCSPAASLVLARVKDASRYGRVDVEAGGRVASFIEKGAGAGGWINGGIYILARELLDEIPKGPYSMETQFLPRLCNGRLFGFPVQGSLVDIGTPGALERVRREGL